jgi:hypothetical protein
MSHAAGVGFLVPPAFFLPGIVLHDPDNENCSGIYPSGLTEHVGFKQRSADRRPSLHEGHTDIPIADA